MLPTVGCFPRKRADSPEFLAIRAKFADYSGYADRSDCAAGCALRFGALIRVRLNATWKANSRQFIETCGSCPSLNGSRRQRLRFQSAESQLVRLLPSFRRTIRPVGP